FWRHIPNCEDRAECQLCATTEDMKHILIECQRPHRALIWSIAKQLWPNKFGIWPGISLGSALGCGLFEFHNTKGEKIPGAQRLFTILMSECMHLIWRLRCDSVIDRGGEEISIEEAYNKLKQALNKRLQQDIQQSNKARWGSHALPKDVVGSCWFQ
ncbi:hypothetical protein BDP27DRAFT_1240826, partial [Rhodocollybia butyracea]